MLSERDRIHEKKASGGFPCTAGAGKDTRMQARQRTGPGGHRAREETTGLGSDKNLPGNEFTQLIRSGREAQTAEAHKKQGESQKTIPQLKKSAFFPSKKSSNSTSQPPTTPLLPLPALFPLALSLPQ